MARESITVIAKTAKYHIEVFKFYFRGIETDATLTEAIENQYPKSGILQVLEVLFGDPPCSTTVWTSLDHLTEIQWAGFEILSSVLLRSDPLLYSSTKALIWIS